MGVVSMLGVFQSQRTDACDTSARYRFMDGLSEYFVV